MASESKGWIAELFARRVPQIVGVYIGACWVAVEMGEWASEQIGFAPSLVAYVFVLMIALLPSVAVLAWNHGAPGKDRSPRFEKFFVPANLVFAVIAVVAFFGYAPPGSPGSSIPAAESALVERVLVDEAGQQQTYTVAREGRHRFVFASFWTSSNADDEAAPDWRQYAIPWLLSIDLNRDPLLSINTPYTVSVIDDLLEAGHAQGIGEPRALAIRLAQRMGARKLVRGELDTSSRPGSFHLSARVFDANSGAMDGEVEAESDSLLAATERIADQLRPLLTPPDAPPDRFTELPLGEATTASMAALETAISGMNRMAFDRDLEAAAEQLEQARTIDPTFALADVWLNQVYRALNDFEASLAAADRALQFEYKLDSQTSFAMKGNRYAMAGDYDTAVRVIRMWTEVHPESFTAWITLAQNMIAMGEAEEARTALQRAEALDPEATRIQRLYASVEALAGDHARAAERLRNYLAGAPDDTAARLELGQTLMRAGQPEAAMDAFREAELVADNPFGPRLQQAALHVRLGEFEAADRLVDAILAGDSGPDRKAPAMIVRLNRLIESGRLADVLQALDEYAPTLQAVYAPLQFWTNQADILRQVHMGLGDPDAALAEINRASDEIGEPMNRYLSVQRIEVLTTFGGDQAAVDAEVERVRLFETSFTFSGALALVRWCEALAVAHAGRIDEAVATMREARDLLRNSGIGLNLDTSESADLTQAELLREAGEAAEARQLLDDLLTRRPANGRARIERAEIHIENGDTEPAREDLEYALALWSEADAEYVYRQRAQELLDAL